MFYFTVLTMCSSVPLYSRSFSLYFIRSFPFYFSFIHYKTYGVVCFISLHERCISLYPSSCILYLVFSSSSVLSPIFGQVLMSYFKRCCLSRTLKYIKCRAATLLMIVSLPQRYLSLFLDVFFIFFLFFLSFQCMRRVRCCTLEQSACSLCSWASRDAFLFVPHL